MSKMIFTQYGYATRPQINLLNELVSNKNSLYYRMIYHTLNCLSLYIIRVFMLSDTNLLMEIFIALYIICYPFFQIYLLMDIYNYMPSWLGFFTFLFGPTIAAFYGGFPLLIVYLLYFVWVIPELKQTNLNIKQVENMIKNNPINLARKVKQERK